jgi:hypothetical protein
MITIYQFCAYVYGLPITLTIDVLDANDAFRLRDTAPGKIRDTIFHIPCISRLTREYHPTHLLTRTPTFGAHHTTLLVSDYR